jgi:hypothetical protein
MTERLIKHYLGHQFVLRHNYAFTYDCLICGLNVFENYQNNYMCQANKAEYEKKLTLTCDEFIIKKLLE